MNDTELYKIMLELAEDEVKDLKEENQNLISINHSLWNYINYLHRQQNVSSDRIDALLNIERRLN